MRCDLPILIFGYGLDLKGSALLYVLLALIALLTTVFVYRYTLPPVPVWRRAVLAVLRIVALALILLLLFEPVLSIFKEQREKQNVLILVDKSASMSVRDADISRQQIVQELLSSSGIRTLEKKAHLHYFSFSDSVEELNLEQLDTIAPSGVGTNLSLAWEKASQALAHEPTTAAILISDGGNNLGPNPVRLAEFSNLPIYTIGVGDTTVRRDAVISEILANEVTYLNSVVPVDIRVKATGLGGKAAYLHLLNRNGEEVARERIHFQGDVCEISVPLKFTAKQVGHQRYRIVLDSISGEWSVANNRRSVMIRVLETRSQVLIFSGPPTPSLSAIRHTLESDSNLEVRTVVESASGRFLLEREPTPEEISEASLIVLINFPSRQTSANLLGKITEAVSAEKIPLVFFAGPAVYQDNLRKIEEVIPFQANRRLPREKEVVLQEAGTHTALSDRGAIPLSWEDLPPVFGAKDNFSAGSLAEVIATLSSVTLGIPEDEPAVLAWSGGGRKGVAFLVWGTYRWKLGLSKDKRGETFYNALINRLARWLISPIEEKRVRITPNKSLYSGGEHVFFRAQIYGSDLTPRDDAATVVRINMGQHSEVLPLQGRGNGRYEAAFTPWGEGEYRFEGIAYAGGDTLGRERGTFVVEAFNIEMLDTRQRADILRRIAEASGGRYASTDQAGEVLAAIDVPLRTIEHHREIPLWNRALMLWLIVGALGIEWFIRKRSGML